MKQKLFDYITAGYPAFYLHSAEAEKVDSIVKDLAKQLNATVYEYSLAYGKVDFTTKGAVNENGETIETELRHLQDELDDYQLILIKDAKLVFENNPLAIARLKHCIERIQRFHQGKSAVILQSPEIYLPIEIEPLITLFELPLPSVVEIKQLVMAITNSPDEIAERIAVALSGINEQEIKQLLQLLLQRFPQFTQPENEQAIFNEIQHQKEQIIAKSGVLEMVKITQQLSDVGGLENLKKWLENKHKIVKNLTKATQFGVKAPKGVLIAGMPGCGKSLAAKATAQLFQQPLLRLDIGSLLGKYVGESESNMRKALSMAESISPCVLWVDELEKAFVGMSGNNASEVSSRLLGYFLTWMQEKTKPVFVIATANDITALPPELLRKGRFDEIFYVGFPNKTERKKILEIHLTKAKQDCSQLNLDELASKCRDYSGADIENAVYEGVEQAFCNGEALNQLLLKSAIQQTVPLRKTMREKVAEYEKKFDELYLTPASHSDGLSIAQLQKMAKNPNYLERIKVAESEDVTEDILAELAKDKELAVRKAVFSNPVCPTFLLDSQIILDEDDPLYDFDLLEIIVKHPHISWELALDKLIEIDKSEFGSLKVSEDLSGGSLLSIFISNLELTEEIQNRLSKSDYARVRSLLANKNTISENTLMTLCLDEDDLVIPNIRLNSLFRENKLRIAGEFKMSLKLFKKLYDENDPLITEELKNNQLLPDEAKKIMFGKTSLDRRKTPLSKELEDVIKSYENMFFKFTK